MASTIYLDNHATTPVDPRVREAMLPYMTEEFGNAASRLHVFGRRADYAVELARQRLASLIGARDMEEIFFTSGATHSTLMAVMGAATVAAGRNHIITTAVEHQATMDSTSNLARQGFEVTRIPVNAQGRISVDDVANAITDRTLLVSVMLANNVVGTLQPIAEIGAITAARGVFFHVDGAQGLGLVPFHVENMGVDLASFSAHKICGPKGVGALYVRRRRRGDNWGVWSTCGTLNVPAIVGFGVAAEIMSMEGRDEAQRVRQFRDRLFERLEDEVSAELNGDPKHTHPGNLNVSIPSLDSAMLAEIRSHVALSHGSACSSQTNSSASHVLLAMGVPESRARSALRIGIGRFNTRADIERASDIIIEAARTSQRPGRSPNVVVNCQGRRVTVPAGQPVSFCAIGSADRFLADVGDYFIPELCDLEKAPRINLVIPSHGSGPELARTLRSLLSQSYGFPTDIIVVVNDGPKSRQEAKDANDDAERWLRAVIAGTQLSDTPAVFRSLDAQVRKKLANGNGMITLRCMRHTVHKGLNEVYQAVISSFIRRIRQHAEKMADTLELQRQVVEELGRRTMLMFVDDDMEFESHDAIQSAYYHATTSDAIILGQYRLRALEGADKLDQTLMRVMQLWLNMKHDLGVNALSPKGMLLRHALEGNQVAVDSPEIADQLYFATLASDRPRYTLPVTTLIQENNYPSNGMFLRDLRKFMLGEDNDGLVIFRNLLELSWNERSTYTREDVRHLMTILATRDEPTILEEVKELLSRADPPRQIGSRKRFTIELETDALAVRRA